MDADDLEPHKQQATSLASKDLDELSIEALSEYIAELKAEVTRTEAAVAAKQSARAGADAFFKT